MIKPKIQPQAKHHIHQSLHVHQVLVNKDLCWSGQRMYLGIQRGYPNNNK